MKFIAKRVFFTARYMFRLYIKNIKIRKMSYYVLYH